TAAADLAERAKAQAERYLDEGGGDNDEKMRAELFGSRKESVKKFVDGLTADQRDLWKALLGEPVKGFDADDLWLKILDEEDSGNDRGIPRNDICPTNDEERMTNERRGCFVGVPPSGGLREAPAKAGTPTRGHSSLSHWGAFVIPPRGVLPAASCGQCG